MRTYKSKGRLFARDNKAPAKWAILDMQETRSYIERLQNPNGRFSHADAKTEALALDALHALGCTDKKIYERAKEYLLTLENPDWGFSSTPGGESSVDGTYHAVSALKKLGVAKKEAADYILHLHRGNGGFVRDVAKPLNNPVNGKIEYTCLAVSTLKLLGRDEEDVFGRAKKFTRRMRHSDSGGFGSSDGIFSDATLENTYYAVKTLEELDSRGAMIDGNKTADYIAGLQNVDGGFSPYRAGEISVTSDRIQVGSGKQNWPRASKSQPSRVSRAVRKRSNGGNDNAHFARNKTTRSDVQSTFYAISSLDSLGVLDKDVRERARSYIMKLKNEDGEFCHSLSEPGPLGEPPGTGTLMSTAYAVLCLEITGRRAET